MKICNNVDNFKPQNMESKMIEEEQFINNVSDKLTQKSYKDNVIINKPLLVAFTKEDELNLKNIKNNHKISDELEIRLKDDPAIMSVILEIKDITDQRIMIEKIEENMKKQRYLKYNKVKKSLETEDEFHRDFTNYIDKEKKQKKRKNINNTMEYDSDSELSLFELQNKREKRKKNNSGDYSWEI